MKLGKLIGKLETQTSINEKEYLEFIKRIKQIKAYFSIEKISVAVEMIATTLQAYYVNIDNININEFLNINNLNEELETGHLQLIEL